MAFVTLPNSSYQLHLDVWVDSQSVANNTTTFRYHLYILWLAGSGVWSNGEKYYSVQSPAGSPVNEGSIWSYDFRDYSSLTLASGSRTFSHNSDGTFPARQWRGGFADNDGSLGDGTVFLSLGAATIPRTPSGLTATLSGGSAVLNWSRLGSTTSVAIDRRVNGGSWSRLATPSGNITTYTDSTVSAGNKYEYRVAGIHSAGTSSWSNTATLSYAPNAPTSASVSRGSDTQHTISLSGGSTRTSLVVHRQTNDGAWTSIGTPSGNLTSWTDTSTVANRKYRYRVAIVSPGGQSGWVYTPVFYTTPAAPSGLTATRVGDDIRVGIGTMPAYASHFDVQDDGTTVGTNIARASFPWTHASPNVAVQHRYRARARVGSGTSNATTLYSGYSAYTAWVQLAAPPNAAMNLSPNGAIGPVGTARTFSWQHNPVDSSAQSAYELRHRLNSGAWTTLSGTTAQSRSITVPLGDTEWQVRTKGVHPDWGPWSAIATFTVVDLPVVTITAPDTLLDRPTILVEWGYAQAQSRPQSAWEVELVHNSVVVESHSGTGATASLTLDYRAAEDESYVVRVRAATGTVWGEWAVSPFDVAYLPPATPIGTGLWNEAEGVVDLSVQVGDDPLAPATVQLSVERSVKADVWEPVLLVEAGDHAFPDGESLSCGTTQYRFTAYTVDGVTASTIIDVVADSGALWLSGGEGFMITARLPFNPEVGLSPWRDRGRHFFDGREKAVAYSGIHTATGVSHSGMILERDFEDASVQVDALEQLLKDPEPVFMWRDPDGRRRYGIVSGEVTRVQHGVWSFSLSLDETGPR